MILDAALLVPPGSPFQAAGESEGHGTQAVATLHPSGSASHRLRGCVLVGAKLPKSTTSQEPPMESVAASAARTFSMAFAVALFRAPLTQSFHCGGPTPAYPPARDAAALPHRRLAPGPHPPRGRAHLRAREAHGVAPPDDRARVGRRGAGRGRRLRCREPAHRGAGPLVTVPRRGLAARAARAGRGDRRQPRLLCPPRP